MMAEPEPPSTADRSYTHRLARLQAAWWKQVLGVQAPYRWNLRRLRPGFVLDIGCGLGRNLAHVDGHGVGIDHNEHSVATARAAGLTVMTPEEFERSEHAVPARFDSLLFAHVLEHLTPQEMEELVGRHLPYLRSDGRVIVITPQERGHASDPTHVTFVDAEAARRLLHGLGLTVTRSYSFPLPRLAGRWFTYNELVTIAQR